MECPVKNASACVVFAAAIVLFLFMLWISGECYHYFNKKIFLCIYILFFV